MRKKVLIGLRIFTVCFLIAALIGCDRKENVKNSEELTPMTYWVSMSDTVSQRFSGFGETDLAKEVQKRTGVNMEYIHPKPGQASDSFNLLFASNNLPDVIEFNWLNYPGGPEKAIKDGYVVELTDKLEGNAPNLLNYLSNNPDIDCMVKTDTGKYFSFPFIRENDELCTSAGLVLRNDWLKKWGLKVPNTIDDWTKTLTVFRDNDVPAPLTLTFQTLSWGAFVGAYNTTKGLYVNDNGVVKYGPAEQSYKSFLELLRFWYEEKLLDNNFASIDTRSVYNNLLDNHSGAAVVTLGSGMGFLMNEGEGTFDLIAARYPTIDEGDVCEFGHIQNRVTDSFAIISKDCENIEKAMKYLDFGYSEEGHLLYNFGIEGKSYSMENGQPIYTKEITQNEQGLSMIEAMSQYTLSYHYGPFVQDARYMQQYAALPQQKAAWETWRNTNAKKHILPIVYFNEDETVDVAMLSKSIETYADEMFIKYVMGSESLDTFDNYISVLKEKGLDRLLDIYQSAYERAIRR